MKVNIFALHYFLWFAAITAIYGYQSVYIERYSRATATQYGLLFMILPFITIGSKLLFCSLADRQGTYRNFFVIFLSTALLALIAYSILPFFVEVKPVTEGLNYGAFATVCFISSGLTISISVISCLSDAFAVNSARKYQVSYGMIRLWGTVAWGLAALALAFINQSEKLPQFVPGLFGAVVLVAIDICIVVLWPNADDFNLDKSSTDVGVRDIEAALKSTSTSEVQPEEHKPVTQEENRPVIQNDLRRDSGGYGGAVETKASRSNGSGTEFEENRAIVFSPERAIDISSVKMQWILFKHVASRRKSIFRYMALFTISGALISLQWSYFFMYLNKIYTVDFILISSLSMVGQSFLGELPFFILSRYIIERLGRSHTLSISIGSIGIRFLLYHYLLPNVSMYFVLLTEMFQGPNFGLFYVVMTEVGLDYSDCEGAIVDIIEDGIVPNDQVQIEKLRQALRATMQSLMSACYEGLGVGIGAILGGLIIDNYGFGTLWNYSAFAALILGFVNFSVDLLKLSITNDDGHGTNQISA